MADNGREKKFRIPKITHKVILKHAKKVETATTKHAHKFIIKRWENIIEVRKQVIVWILVMCLLIAATGVQLVWFQESYLSNTASNDGTYAEAVLGSIDTLNPLYANTSAEQSASSLLFSRLLNYDKTGHINFDLVKNISVDDAKKVYTVSIRDDAFWSDGENITSNDIMFTVDLMKNESARTTVSGWSNISIDKINEYTVKFTIQNTYAAFIYALNFPIIPEHVLGKVSVAALRENSFSQTPVSSGPFRLNFIQNIENSNGHKVIHLVRNENYYGGTAKLARFQLSTYGTSEEILKALANNEVNAAADLTPSDTKHVNKSHYSVVSNSIQSGMYTLLNTRSAMLSDINLRKALRLATDTSAIRNELGSNSKALDLPFTESQIGVALPIVPAFNKSEAEQILTANGWIVAEDGKRFKNNQPLKLSVITVKGSEFESVLEILANQWRSVGFDIETKVVDPNDATQNATQNILQPRSFDVFVYQLDLGADPDVYAYWHSTQASAGGLNFSNYSNVISDSALASARNRTETDIRNSKYLTFAKQWIADIPAIGLYQSTAQYVFGNNVNSYNKTNTFVSPIDRYGDVLNWSVGSQTVYKTP